MIKEGCVIIDVGMNSVDDPNDKRGYHLCGDVDYNDVCFGLLMIILQCYEKCRLITPVPGGVGPMTIAMLMKVCILILFFDFVEYCRSWQESNLQELISASLNDFVCFIIETVFFKLCESHSSFFCNPFS